MFATTVEFNIKVSDAIGQASVDLDALVARWGADPQVSSVAVEWKSTSQSGSGHADVNVSLNGDSRGHLRKAYERLTRQITKERTLL
ncbi:MAG: hypothetical protein KDA52_25070, partial [Planctomycetaceae bacterium]|nr:hypothetical protein [Planctomycetaceae bacterium]